MQLKFCTAAPDAPLTRLSMHARTIAPPRHADGQIAEVGVGYMFGGGQLLHHSHKWVFSIRLPQGIQKFRLPNSPSGVA